MTRCGLILVLTYCLIVTVFAEDETDTAKNESEDEDDDDDEGPPSGHNKPVHTESKTSVEEQDPKSKIRTTQKPAVAPPIPVKAKSDIPSIDVLNNQQQQKQQKDAFIPTTAKPKPKKKSPWEKMLNAPTFVGHLVVPYPSSNFISLTMKQAYVLYLWLQVRRLKELFKNPESPKVDGELNLDDINAMISDYSKTSFMKLPIPYKPPLFLPTDSENIEGTGDESQNSIDPATLSGPFGKKAALPVKEKPMPQLPPTTTTTTTTTKGPTTTTPAPTLPPTLPPTPRPKSIPTFPPTIKKPTPLEATGSQNFPPPASSSFPSFPAFRSQVYAKKNPKVWPSHLPLKMYPGIVWFPSKATPLPKAVYPPPVRPKPMSAQKPRPAPKAFAKLFPHKLNPPSPVQPKLPFPQEIQRPQQVPPQIGPKLLFPQNIQQPQQVPPQIGLPSRPFAVPEPPERRRFYQRVANYMNQLGAQGQRIPNQ